MIRFILNNKEVSTDLSPGYTLVDFIRYNENLKGTKIGCREGDCGACTVLVGEIMQTGQAQSLRYRTMTSCLMPLANAHGKHIVTVEGINFDGGRLNPIQKAMTDEGATQCGFCTPGFVMSLAGFCLNEKLPTGENAIAAVDGNICRCTGYKSIERACGLIAEVMKEKNGTPAVQFVTEKNILPEYFSTIEKRLSSVNITNGKLFTVGEPFMPPVTDNEVTTNNYSLSTVVGGGPDVYVQKPEELKESPINPVFDQQELRGIEKQLNICRGILCMMGGSSTVTDLQNSELLQKFFPELNRFIRLISSTPIRNMATAAGNFVNASPIGDLTIFFLALDAQLILNNGKDKRELMLRNFYKGYKSLNKQPEEWIEKIWFELPGKDFKFNFEKVSKRTNLDIASVNSAIGLKMTGDKIFSAGISAGGVAPVPMYLQKASEFLRGKSITKEVIDETIEIAQTEISPISDVRGSAEYKRLLLGQLIKAHFINLFPAIKAEKLIFG